MEIRYPKKNDGVVISYSPDGGSALDTKQIKRAAKDVAKANKAIKKKKAERFKLKQDVS